MKRLVAICVLLLGFSAFAADPEDDYFENMDSLFENTVDTVVEDSSLNFKDKTEKLSNFVSEAFKFPVKFSGNLDAQLGFVVWPESWTKSVYFDFDNHYVITAIPKDYLSITTDFKIAFKNAFDAEVYQIYFDYVPFSHIFIDGGKRNRSLTVAKIFSSDTDFLSDSKESITGSITFTHGSFSVTGMALYHLAFVNASSEYDEKSVESQITQAENDAQLINYLFNMDFVVFNTNINLFFRKWQNAFVSNEDKTDYKVMQRYFNYGSSCAPEIQSWTWGIQVRKNVLGTDCYLQESVTFDPFHEEFKKSSVEGTQFVAGLYRYWEYDFAKFGFNAEYHYLFDQRNGINAKKEFGLTAAVSRLFDGHIAIAATWKHDFESKEGTVTPGIILSNVVKGAKLEVGTNFVYNKENEVTASAGIKLNISIDY